MANTKERILKKALELFNENGIEYVGMRELAAAMDLRIGNLTYYFATKDDLVFTISESYSASNTALYATYPVNGLKDFLDRQQALFTNMVGYRCLLLSMVHLMDRNPLIAANYEKVKNRRYAALEQTFKTLHQNGSLQFELETDLSTLLSFNSLLGRFWISEAALSGKRSPLAGQTGFYLKLLGNLLKPYATKKGLKEIASFEKQLAASRN